MPVPAQDGVVTPGTMPDDIIAYLYNLEKRHLVWDALRPWFEAQGYILYPNRYPGKLSEVFKYDLSEEHTDVPSVHVGDKSLRARMRSMIFIPPALFSAVSRQHQDVMIKVLSTEGDETDILKHLMSEPQCSDPLNTTIPILDVLTFDDRYSFLVMPRWGPTDPLLDTGFDCLGTAFEYALCLLKALAFLHKNLIVHRDIRPGNVLVNFYAPGQANYQCFFASKHTKFALCDFGCSTMFPSDILPADRVCPAADSECGTFEYHPPDVAEGATVYDPFAYDVACMGGLLCEVIGYMTPLAPPLAPFLDRMITPDLCTRYTAAEALDALLQLKDSLDPKCFDTPAPAPPSFPQLHACRRFDLDAKLL
ncbi:unnamed protein product [Somion occarium]|uniref:Protein kinase domain-containing protein n=1 Tax=Somion occarium TaxID=3059160 RepID=A0ABP1CUQ9_9APHY